MASVELRMIGGEVWLHFDWAESGALVALRRVVDVFDDGESAITIRWGEGDVRGARTIPMRRSAFLSALSGFAAEGMLKPDSELERVILTY